MREKKKQSCCNALCFSRADAIFTDLMAIFTHFGIICDIPIGAVYITSDIDNVATFFPPFYDYYKSGPNSTTEPAIQLGRLF